MNIKAGSKNFFLLSIIIQTSMHAAVQQISQSMFTGRNLMLIAQTGNYCLAESMFLDEKPIIINANNVELDLGNNVIEFSKYNPYGIFITPGCKNITIKNGTINSAAPIAFTLKNNSKITLTNLIIRATGNIAMSITQSSVVRINHVMISGTKIDTGIKILKSSDVHIDACSIHDIATKQLIGVNIQDCDAITCSNTTIVNNKTPTLFNAFIVNKSFRTVLSQNTISMNTAPDCTGIDISSGERNTITRNEIHLNSTETSGPRIPMADYSLIALDKKNTKIAGEGIFIGIKITEQENGSVISHNRIHDNASGNTAYGLCIKRNLLAPRNILVERNDIAKNNGPEFQFGIYDEDSLSKNTYINNKVSFHGRCLDGSSMPIPALPKTNYYFEKEGPITNLIRESNADELSFFPGDIQDKNLSIW